MTESSPLMSYQLSYLRRLLDGGKKRQVYGSLFTKNAQWNWCL